MAAPEPNRVAPEFLVPNQTLKPPSLNAPIRLHDRAPKALAKPGPSGSVNPLLNTIRAASNQAPVRGILRLAIAPTSIRSAPPPVSSVAATGSPCATQI